MSQALQLAVIGRVRQELESVSTALRAPQGPHAFREAQVFVLDADRSLAVYGNVLEESKLPSRSALAIEALQNLQQAQARLPKGASQIASYGLNLAVQSIRERLIDDSAEGKLAIAERDDRVAVIRDQFRPIAVHEVHFEILDLVACEEGGLTIKQLTEKLSVGEEVVSESLRHHQKYGYILPVPGEPDRFMLSRLGIEYAVCQGIVSLPTL